MKTQLPLVTNCDDCGACCTHIGTPPAFFSAYASPKHDGVFLTDQDDWQYWQAMPESLRQEMRDFYASQDHLDVTECRSESGLPCLWYDAATRRCRHYEYRPQVCREYEVGEESCLEHRRRCGIGGDQS